MMSEIVECTYKVPKNYTTQKLFIIMALSLGSLYEVPADYLIGDKTEWMVRVVVMEK